MSEQPRITVRAIDPVEFERLWNMPEDGYPCDGDCGQRLSGRGYCATCVERERRRLEQWNALEPSHD